MIRLLLLLVLFALPAQASPLVADLSNYRIDIDSGFNGTRLFLFGARNDNGDIVLVVRGPEKNFTVRKKEKMAGIWVNTQQMTFKRVPDFFFVAASRTFDPASNPDLYKQLKISPEFLLTPTYKKEEIQDFMDFSQAFFRYQQQRRLYVAEPKVISFMGETLFKTEVDFPDTIPKGDYTAEIYLISDGEIVGVQNTPIHVAKSGMDAFISDYAHRQPLLYGISAVLLALGAGWGVGRLFERF